jgi:hypothetical protein
MDLAMVKQEQGETLRKYMCRFFDKRATVVDVIDKEVIDLFQDGLYHRCTFEDFGHRRPKSIPHLKDMITSWVDEENKANAMMEVYAASKKLATSELDIPEKSDSANKPQPPEEVLVKTIDLGTVDPSKTTTIGASLENGLIWWRI